MSNPMDRWVEIDLYWLDREHCMPGGGVLGSMRAAFRGGWRGVRRIINIGWLVDFVTEWNGDPHSRISFPQQMPIRCHFAAKKTRKSALFGAFACISMHHAKKPAEPVFKPLNECWRGGDPNGIDVGVPPAPFGQLLRRSLSRYARLELRLNFFA